MLPAFRPHTDRLTVTAMLYNAALVGLLDQMAVEVASNDPRWNGKLPWRTHVGITPMRITYQQVDSTRAVEILFEEG